MNVGGIWSKLGNRYEAKWLVHELLDVIRGNAEWLRFEGVTAEFNGFEGALHWSVWGWNELLPMALHEAISVGSRSFGKG